MLKPPRNLGRIQYIHIFGYSDSTYLHEQEIKNKLVGPFGVNTITENIMRCT